MNRTVLGPVPPPGAPVASRDTVTGLPRREELLERGPALLARAAEIGRPVVLLVLDLDGFKELNDVAGHHVGDRVLAEVGVRLRGQLGPGDLVVRLGGDEFAAFCPSLAGPDEAAARAESVIAALAEPMEVDDLVLSVGVSVGLARSDRDGSTLEELLLAADQAMYAAKAAGSGRWRASSPPDARHASSSPRLARDLRAGLAADRLLLHYQPQVSVSTGEPVGFEALVRWDHDDLGLLTAREFVPLAERTGTMAPITARVIDLALRDLPALQRIAAGARLSLNVTRRHVLARGLVEHLTAAVGAQGHEPRDLVLEITEPVSTLGAETSPVFTALARAGFGVSIRGFGTARSSLTTLWNNPAAREIKVDPGIVADLHDPRTLPLVQALTGAAHGLGIRVVAEGVEDATAAATLARIGCDVLQGYWVGAPADLAATAAWREAWSPDRVRGLRRGPRPDPALTGPDRP
ncbi:putative bifunctional diguanylate cyclase/phosphodiesterase [Nocardioides litoris]|uniref:putative bifunctional diguanylate cyclase/phosphodiesterase n=1 Tax=Nocardioides litoris TaxID=1926648 RepID=UPI0014768B19|nr:EAL domain-containing protein [Nocardioides litoris]